MASFQAFPSSLHPRSWSRALIPFPSLSNAHVSLAPKTPFPIPFQNTPATQATIDNEAFTMCFIRKFTRKRLNLLTDSKEKR